MTALTIFLALVGFGEFIAAWLMYRAATRIRDEARRLLAAESEFVASQKPAPREIKFVTRERLP